jgi:peptidylprolyl isomerase
MKKFSFFTITFLMIFFMNKTMAQSSMQGVAKNNQNNNSSNSAKPNANLENLLYIDLTYGRVIIEMMPNIAPKHIERIKALARQKFYDGIVFHRVIDGFMAQTGDPTGTGMGGSKLPDIKAEFSDEPHIRGAVSMARASDPNSANSQFFIVTHDSRFLDGQYTIWGRVISGMEFVDKIKKGASRDGKVVGPDGMVKVRLASDDNKM